MNVLTEKGRETNKDVLGFLFFCFLFTCYLVRERERVSDPLYTYSRITTTPYEPTRKSHDLPKNPILLSHLLSICAILLLLSFSYVSPSFSLQAYLLLIHSVPPSLMYKRASFSSPLLLLLLLLFHSHSHSPLLQLQWLLQWI